MMAIFGTDDCVDVAFLKYETSVAECSEMNTNIYVLSNVQR